MRYAVPTWVFVGLILFSGVAIGQTGYITGTVIDKQTQSPLPGANVIVVGTDYGASTDTAGHYIISNLPAGSYNLRFRMMGYRTLEKFKVPVSPDRFTQMDVALPMSVMEGEEVVVEATAFVKARDAVVSDRNIDYAEMARDPGGAYDIQRMMQALPAVVSGTDQDNEIIVRGGSPGENLFLMDNIEIPNPNHFGWQGTGGGPISMINPLFVREVDFYAGAFPARYGGKASSVMDIHLKEGSRERFGMNLDMGMSGVGLFAEGPVFNGDVSYMFGFHKSYLDLIINSFGMTAVPQYYSLQGKVVWHLNAGSTLIWNGIYGNDAINIEEASTSEQGVTELADVNGWEYATGLSLKTLYDEHRYSLITLSNVANSWDYDVREVKSGGHGHTVYSKDDLESDWTLKGDYFHRINEHHDFIVGASIKSLRFDHQNWAPADTIWGYRYFYANDPTPHTFTVGNPWEIRPDSFAVDRIIHTNDKWNLNRNIYTAKFAVYGQYKWRPVPRIMGTAGVRLSYFEYSDYLMAAPRFGLSYYLRENTTVNFGYGRHFQEPAYTEFTANPELNRNLRSKYTDQYVMSLEHLFARDMKGSIEIYRKDYRDLVVPRSWVERDSLDDYNGERLNAGEGRARGIEFFLQKKLSRNVNFTVSYSHYIAERKDPRSAHSSYYTAGYDFRNVFTLMGGYRWEMLDYQWYRNIRERGWWKALSWLISPGDELEVSFRWRYTGGRPYTEQTYDPYLRRWYTRWGAELNTQRLPEYHRLDLLILRRWLFKGSALVTYIDIMNIYGRQNIWEYTYKSDGTRGEIYQFNLFPVGGFVLEF